MADPLAGGALRAIKILADLERAQNLRSEFAALSSLAHPGIVRLHAFAWDARKGPLLVMDRVDGPDLLTAARGLDPRQRAALVAQILRALAYVHERGILHLDLKPANVLVEGGRIRIVDFGLAGREWKAAKGATPTWAAPEQLRGLPVDRRTDLYAVGALAFALATGGPPPLRDRAAAVARIRGPLGEVVRLLLRDDPEDRPASAVAALRRLCETGALEQAESPAEIAAWIPHVPAMVRASEVARALACLDGGRAVAAVGPEGMGEEAFLGEVARRRAGDGWIVLRTAQGEGPLEPFVPVLRAAAALLPGGEAADARALLAPWIGGTEGSFEPRDAASLPTGWAGELGLAAAELIAASARANRLLIVVDGADRLEPASRVAVHELVGARIPLLLSAREPIDTDGVVEFPLQPLDLEAVQRWLASVYPERTVPEGFVAALHRWSGGLPALVEEGLRGLAATGRAVPGVGTTAALPVSLAPGELPCQAEVAQQVASRALDVGGRVAALLAIAERPLTEGEMSRLLGLPREEVAERIDRLVAVGAARRDEPEFAPGPEPTLRIAGDALAEAVAARVREEDRRELHLLLAAELQRRSAEAPPAEAALLLAARARHLLAASVPGAAEAALEAGLACARTAAWREAAELLAIALDRGLGDASTRCTLAAALAASGETEAALAAYRLAAREGAGAEAAIGEAEVLVRRGAFREAVAALEPAVDGAGPPRLRVVAALARALAFSGRHEEALRWANDGLAEAGGRRDAVVCDLHDACAVALYQQGDLAAARASWLEAEALAEAIGDRGRSALGVNGRAMIAHRQGDRLQAAALYREALLRARAARDLSRTVAPHINLGALAMQRGQTAEAAAQYRQAAAVARALGDLHAAARAALNLAVLHRYVGRLEAAVEAARTARDLAARSGASQVGGAAAIIEGEALLFAGEIEPARRLLAEACAALHGVDRLEASLSLGEALLLDGDAAAVAERARAVIEASGALPAIRVRAQLLAAEAALAQPSPDLPAVRRLLYEALALAEVHGGADVRWRLHRALFLAHRAAGEAELARAEAAAARRFLALAAEELPPQDRAPFLARPDRRRAQEELALAAPAGDHGSALRILALNRRLAEERDLDRLLAAIVDAAIELSGAERGFVLLPGEQGVEIRMARGFSGHGADVPVSRSIAERVLRTGEPELSIDAVGDERYRDQLSIHDLRLRSVVCLPLGFRGERIGALYLDNRLRSGVFADDMLVLLEAFAAQAGIALGNARLLAEAEAARAQAAVAAEEVRRLAAALEAQVEQQAAELASAREVLAERAITGMVGRSLPMRRLAQSIEKVAVVSASVLIQGESGTGKELVARAIHQLGPRRDRPFVAINCAAIAESMLEAELFGHVKGAFTGADRDRRGLFELADGGTLFLDEVADMSLAMQAKLLRALQSGEIWRVGGRTPLRVDVRVLAATNKPLAAEVEAGRFREDLFYRLNVVALEVPPLRDRKEDIPLLAEHFLEAMARADGGERRLRLSPEALEVLMLHDWPGNVRELEAALQNAAIFADGPVIRAEDLPFVRRRIDPMAHVPSEPLPLAEVELELIERTLQQTGGNKARAARILGIDRKTLYNKLRRRERGGAA